MRIPDFKIDEVRSSSDIVDIIASHVRLKKRGKNFIGLCPFHQEKTPSFAVSAEKQMYHCFGCHKGGNVFTFVMEYEKVSFVEAVRSLAGRAGIVLPTEEIPSGQQTEIEALYNACRFAGLHFYNNLTKTDEGRSALEYFHSRGFSDETIRSFGLGYSSQSWDSLLRKGLEEGISKEQLLKAGLVRSREDGTHYDYFRGRAMFPIFATTGRVIAFGARKMRDDDPLGKYINSPETPIYNKSRVLFGLFHSKDSIRGEDRAYMVEGYADLLSLYQAGVQNVVASSGTALTEDQLLLLARYSKKLNLVYDADSAGSSATLRGVDLALEQDFDVKVIDLPEGDDPDSFVRKHGAKEFRKLAEQAVSFIDFKARQFQKTGAFLTPEGKSDAVRSIVQSIAKMKDELKRNFYIKEVAEKYEIYESVLYRELDRWLSRDRPPRREGAGSQRVPVYDVPLSDVTIPKGGEIPAAERDLLKLLLEGQPDIVDLIFKNLTVEQFADQRAKRLAELLQSRWRDLGEINAVSVLNETDDTDLKGMITDISLSKYELSKGWVDKEIDEPDARQIAADALALLRKRALQKAIEENQRMLKEAAQRGSDKMPFVVRHQELMRQMKESEKA
ncbi:MAG: DNA primase [Ignavibacteriales bacterium]|nr:DNA primase [Ignavibacteriales bacterium]